MSYQQSDFFVRHVNDHTKPILRYRYMDIWLGNLKMDQAQAIRVLTELEETGESYVDELHIKSELL